MHTNLFDVTKEKEVAKNVSKIEKEVGPVDILLSNAGIIKSVPLADMDVEDYKKVIDVDLVEPFIIAKHLVQGHDNVKRAKSSTFVP